MNKNRTPVIAGNWKLNHGGASAAGLAQELARHTAECAGVEIVVAPPFTALSSVHAALRGTHVALAGQNMFPKDSGAFTGEISASMLRDVGCQWVILGHSERRQYFGETDASVAEKVTAALAAGLKPIACLGETLEEREAQRTLEVVRRQLAPLAAALLKQVGAGVIAYEPVWAIGTGRVAGPDQAQEVHAAIRAELRALSPDLAEKTRILYGGSVKADNAASLLACADIDGALVGGASLKADDFSGIARAARA